MGLFLKTPLNIYVRAETASLTLFTFRASWIKGGIREIPLSGLLLSLDGCLDKLLHYPVLLSLTFILLAVAEPNQAVKLYETKDLGMPLLFLFSSLPSLKGSTSMTAWMKKCHSESV